jgi:glutamate dehydrogenase (NAD(P)+)
MDDVFRFGDDLGPGEIVFIERRELGLRAIVVVDNVAAGPAIGGVRMAADVSLEECVRLARAMTLKNAAAGLSHGGAKSVIFADPAMPLTEKEALVRAFARAVRDIDEYIAGPDMGTDERCMAWVHDEIGRSVGLPAVLGGIPLDEIGATGFGLAVAAEVAEQFCDVQLRGARVAIQGFGAVGRHAARFIAERGAVLVAAADSHGTLHAPAGIDVDRLIAIKRSGGSVLEYAAAEQLSAEQLSAEAIVEVECDLWIPAARPDVIDAGNVQRLRARLVVEGANIPITWEAERALHDRGVLVIPDFIANAGGVICAAVEYAGGSRAAAFQSIEAQVRANTFAVLAAARERAAPPRAAAVELAEARVREAMSYRRAR